MAKELPFFKFDVSEWMFGRIQKQPDELQGMFINLCCKYWHKLGEYSYESACLDFSQDRLDTLLKSKLIGNEDGYIVIQFLDIQLDECAAASNKQRIKGLKSAQLRAERKLKATTVQPRLESVKPNPTEEKRREEKIGEYPVEISDWIEWGKLIVDGNDQHWHAIRGRKITAAEMDIFLSVAVRCGWKLPSQSAFRVSLKGFKAKDHEKEPVTTYTKGRAFGDGQ